MARILWRVGGPRGAHVRGHQEVEELQATPVINGNFGTRRTQVRANVPHRILGHPGEPPEINRKPSPGWERNRGEEILRLAEESREKYEVTAASSTKQVTNKERSGQTAGVVISNLRCGDDTLWLSLRE